MSDILYHTIEDILYDGVHWIIHDNNAVISCKFFLFTYNRCWNLITNYLSSLNEVPVSLWSIMMCLVVFVCFCVCWSVFCLMFVLKTT